ncbi:hypothetical protein KIN34_03905 [Cellulomonas sp. DKR-3]|uniref:Lipoprotein n=1 Tax=Cellulomonas fulva TaxID=2835530 RepID=A0ABS5TW98_9CELL|nr:hypothetical protein [Cellulomonas fulva]MBT0993428.1 hypothetical protein [Cellulomonas fulva]
MTGVAVVVLTGCGATPDPAPPSSAGVGLEEHCALAVDIEEVVAEPDGADVVVTWRDTREHLAATEYLVARRAPDASVWEVVGTVELEPGAERRFVDSPPTDALPAEYTVAAEGSCVRFASDICVTEAPCPVATALTTEP